MGATDPRGCAEVGLGGSTCAIEVEGLSIVDGQPMP